MPDRKFYIGGEWLTYEQAHRLGYTRRPPKILTLYTQSNSRVQIRQDVSDNTYYDSASQTWVDDFYALNLYEYINTIACYRGESKKDYRGFSNHANDNSIAYILYNSRITDLQSLYETKGITTYKCKNVIVDGNSNPVVWYDASTKKYFDDRDGYHQWVDHIDDVLVTMYDTSAHQSKQIYENDVTDSFYIDSSFVSRDDFYSYDSNGIIRDTIYTFLEPSLCETYYDSYSDEYCVPNVSSIWLSRDGLTSLGYTFIEGIADMWLCHTPLHLPWKYLPKLATLSFTNTSHPELPIELPAQISAHIGDSVILPDLTGTYVDSNYHKYSTVAWDIGNFNAAITLERDTSTDLILEPVQATVTFTNTRYPLADVTLPDSITVNTGEQIELPEVQGTYTDTNTLRWQTSSWDAGAFNSYYIVADDIEIDLVWEQISTYNVVDDSGVIVHSGQSIVYTTPIDTCIQDQSLITYGNIGSIICDSHELVYARIDPVIQTAPRLIISSGEAIPPADLVIYNEDTGEISSSIFKKTVVTFSTSHIILSNPNAEIVFGGTSFITLDNALEDIVIAQTNHITANDSDLQTVLVTELPTVSTSGDFGDYNYLTANTSGGSTTLSPGGTWVPYIGGTTNTANYNTSFTYATVNAYDSNLSEVDRTSLGYFNTNPNLGWKNIGTSSIEVRQAKVAVCHSVVDVITVYNVNNVAYNAFKYTDDSTDYYYVIDGIHTSWIDDLASIGYSTVYLPRVFSYTGTQASSSISPDASFDTGLTWDANKLYIGETNDGQGNITRYGWEAEENEPLPHIFSYTNTQTATSVAAGESFDTGLTWDSSKLYIGETNDEHGNVTMYGWEAVEMEPCYTVCGVIGSTLVQDITVRTSYEMFGILSHDS